MKPDSERPIRNASGLRVTAIKTASSRQTPFKLYRGRGMFPLVNPDGDTIRAVAEEWLGIQTSLFAGTVEQVRTRLTTCLCPKIGHHKAGSIAEGGDRPAVACLELELCAFWRPHSEFERQSAA